MKIKIIDNDNNDELNKNEIYNVQPFWLDEDGKMLSLLILNKSKEETK